MAFFGLFTSKNEIIENEIYDDVMKHALKILLDELILPVFNEMYDLSEGDKSSLPKEEKTKKILDLFNKTSTELEYFKLKKPSNYKYYLNKDYRNVSKNIHFKIYAKTYTYILTNLSDTLTSYTKSYQDGEVHLSNVTTTLNFLWMDIYHDGNASGNWRETCIILKL